MEKTDSEPRSDLESRSEARRRRILQGGNKRLAYITGQGTLPEPVPVVPHTEQAASSSSQPLVIPDVQKAPAVDYPANVAPGGQLQQVHARAAENQPELRGVVAATCPRAASPSPGLASDCLPVSKPGISSASFRTKLWASVQSTSRLRLLIAFLLGLFVALGIRMSHRSTCMLIGDAPEADGAVLNSASAAPCSTTSSGFRLGEHAALLPGFSLQVPSPLVLLLLTQATVVIFAYIIRGNRVNRVDQVQTPDNGSEPISLNDLFGQAFTVAGAAGPAMQPPGFPGLAAADLQLSALVDKVQTGLVAFSATSMLLREFSLFFVTLVLTSSLTCQACGLLVNSSAAQSCVDFHSILQHICAGC